MKIVKPPKIHKNCSEKMPTIPDLKAMQNKMEEEARQMKLRAREEARKNRNLRMNRMEQRFFYFLMHRDQVIRSIIAIAAIALSVTSYILLYNTQILSYNIESLGIDIRFGVDATPLLILMGLFGLVPGMLAFSILLIYKILVEGSFAYMMAVVLLAEIMFFRRIKRRVLLSPRRTVLMIIGLSLLLGNLYNMLVMFGSGMGFEGLSPLTPLMDFVGALPEVVFCVLFVRIILVRMPEAVRRYLYMGDYYSQDPEVVSRVELERLPSKIEKKMTRLIVAEALALGIGAAGFANYLIPDVADSVIEEMHENAQRRRNAFDDIIDAFGNNDSSSDTGEATADTGDDNSVGSGEESSDTGEAGDETAENATENRDENGIPRKPDDRIRRRFVLNQAGIAFDIKLIMMLLNIAIPFVVLTVYIAKRQIAIPIDRMASALKEFSDSPDDEKESSLHTIHELDIINNDEIGMLYGSMDRMAEDVVGYVDSVRREQQLQEDLRVAQASAEAKSRFFSQMSHELRTPINAVLGLDEMIIRESHEPPIKDYAIDIKSAGRSLLSLINDILDNSKLEAGKMDIINVEYELSSVINDLVNMIQTKADEKGLDFNVKIDENIPHLLEGDEVRIKQVILNILTNGVKYTESGSVTLTMDCEKRDEENIALEIHVKDTGIGIKAEDLEKLYTPFQRIEEERNRNVEGTGLGMNIVKQLLELMGSSLEVESVYGEGSDFHFVIVQKVIRWDPIGNFCESYERAKAAMEAYHESFRAPDARILIVDDTPLNLTVAAGLIKETEVRVDTADSGAATLDLVRNNRYDIIFLDHMMPQMDGIETLKAMKELEGNLCKETPVIALTANAVSGARTMYMEAGFDDYLTKPIDGKRFESMIMQYLPDELILPPEEHKTSEGEMVPLDPGASGLFVSGSGSSGSDTRAASETDSEYAFLREINSIDYETAVQNTGSDELLAIVLHDYLEAIPSKSAEIEKYWNEGDYHNYEILVHALKSSSRLIGAQALSRQALSMEEAAKKATEGDEEAIALINDNTPGLLKDYRNYFDKLNAVFSNNTDEDTRPEISREELMEALGAVNEFVKAFDFDSADMVMAQIKDYKVPEELEADAEAVKRALAEVDQAKLVSILDEILN